MTGKYRPFWLNEQGDLEVIDQRFLPHERKIRTLKTGADAAQAISDMTVRGAGVIGNIAAFGIYLSAREFGENKAKIYESAQHIRETRPTAVNLMWAVDRMLKAIKHSEDMMEDAKSEAIKICDEDVKRSELMGDIGCNIIETIMEEKGLKTFNILTHCNAGWLAIINNGSALAPIYEAHRRGIKIHVWVDETRPRNQGANLTSWELMHANIPHTIIPDNTGGHLMQHGMVDMVITGADRVAVNGDAANKIGTYLKALAAQDNDVPFYIALPLSTFDFACKDGIAEIEIEQRSQEEVHIMHGLNEEGERQSVRVTPQGAQAANYGFDVTPARLITGLITEAGLIEATKSAIKPLERYT